MSEQTILSPQETAACLLALAGMIEDLKAVASDPKLPFDQTARKEMREMLSAATSAKLKLEAIANNGQAFKLDEYREGDENQFFTKPS
jgi:hypothetical protein